MFDKVAYLNDFTPAEPEETPVVDPQPKPDPTPTPDPAPTPDPTETEEPTEEESSEVSEDIFGPSRFLVTLTEEEFGDVDVANKFAEKFSKSIEELRAKCD